MTVPGPGSLRETAMTSLPSRSASLVRLTSIVLLVSPSAKVNVPGARLKSESGVALPEVLA